MTTCRINDHTHHIAHSADTMLLAYLRETLHLTGTKEGCGSGDCGACTVLLGQQGEYRAINACITPVGAVHGGHVVTVEHIADGDTLHPVQQAMIDEHASQCGFCTPGFVISGVAHYHGGGTPEGIVPAIAGNLCRCTGYRPIVSALQTALAQREETPPHWAQDALPLDDMDDTEQAASPATSYWRPHTLADFQRLRAQYPEAELVAGATDLALRITQNDEHIAQLIDVSGIDALRVQERRADQLVLGAALSYRESQDALLDAFPQLAALWSRIGGPQVRTRGTLGGNLGSASPIGDVAPVLIALGGAVRVSNGSTARTIAIDDFFTGYRQSVLRHDELIEQLIFPIVPQTQLFAYKISKRIEDDISTVLLCAALRLDLRQGEQCVARVRIGLGGMAATPLRARGIEQALQGASLQQDWQALTHDAVAALTPMSDVRASADYRRTVTSALLARLRDALCGIDSEVPEHV